MWTHIPITPNIRWFIWCILRSQAPAQYSVMIFGRLLLCWTLLCCSTASAALADELQTLATAADPAVDLDSLSDAELEAICYDLGFELLNNVEDNVTGAKVEFTHKDYVEAARQCLAVKEQM